jgi:hypothetical protein
MTGPLIEPAELVTLYTAHPGVLEEEVAQVFAVLRDDVDRVMHNIAVGKVGRLFRSAEDQRLLWTNVAQAILRTATQTVGVTHGQT